MMSALYMGDVLAAVLLSMRSYGVLHAWFSAYRPDFAPLSPGLILWLELARLCPELGIRRIDMGKGPEEYKRHLMSGAIDVAEGSVDLRPVPSRGAAAVAPRLRLGPAFALAAAAVGPRPDPPQHGRSEESPPMTLLDAVNVVLLAAGGLLLLPIAAFAVECLAALLP